MHELVPILYLVNKNTLWALDSCLLGHCAVTTSNATLWKLYHEVSNQSTDKLVTYEIWFYKKLNGMWALRVVAMFLVKDDGFGVERR
jgi:hypothetical protein